MLIIYKWQPSGASGLMDKAPASGAGDCGFKSHLGREYMGINRVSSLKQVGTGS